MGLRLAGQRQLINEQERGQDTQYKRAEIQDKDILSQDTGVGIEKDRDQQSSCQYSQAERRSDTGTVLLKTVDHEQPKQQHREEY